MIHISEFAAIRFTVILFLLLSVRGIAQDPAYFEIGAQQLSNTDVYSILYTSKDELYVASDHGLFAYKHGDFVPIKNAPGQYGSSVFFPVEDREGNIYCCNLGGQVFKVTGMRLELIYQIHEKDLTDMVFLSIDDSDNLLVGSGRLEILLEGESKLVPIPYKNGKIYSLTRFPDGEIAICLSRSDSLYLWYDGKLKTRPLNGATRKFGNYWTIAKAQGNYRLFFKPDQHFESEVTTEQIHIQHAKSQRIVQLDDTIIMGMNNAFGCRILYVQEATEWSKQYFSNTFISCAERSPNGTIFLGTFGEGIRVVPRWEVTEIRDPSVNSISTLCACNNRVYAGARDGRLFNISSLHFKDARRIEGGSLERLFCLSEKKWPYKQKDSLLYGSYDNATAYRTIKDVAPLGVDGYLIAASNGLFFRGENVPDSSGWGETRQKNVWRLSGVKGRVHAALWADSENEIVFATPSGLYKSDLNGRVSAIYFDGRPISCTSLTNSARGVAVGTHKEGVLLYRHGRVSEYINTNRLATAHINKLESDQGNLYIATDQGFFVLDGESELHRLGRSNGLMNSIIKDFTVTEEAIWFSMSRSVVSMPLPLFDKHYSPVRVDIDSIYVNNKRMSRSALTLKSGNSKIRFFVGVRSVERMKEMQIAYRLKGFEDEWNVVPATTNEIVYKSVPSGKFVFEVKALHDFHESELLSVPVNIKAPFWEESWFFVAVTSASVLITAFIFIRIIKRLKRRNREKLLQETMEKELIESKLKALRSQMNPHFIFNAINSIQDLILREDTESSYDYVVLFSDLVRKTLSFSDREFIALSEEIEFLNTYLSLEELRFSEELTYSISSSAPDSLEIPSLMIQPFVENCIHHGLLHKHGPKKLSIVFSVLEEVLVCVIQDNGVGRKMAKEIKDRQGNTNESFSVKAIENRMANLKQKSYQVADYQYSDLIDKQGNSQGTRVEIRLSCKK